MPQIQSNMVSYDLPHHPGLPKHSQQREKDILESETGIQESHEYVIYQNGVSMMNEWLYTHLMYFGDRFIRKHSQLHYVHSVQNLQY